MSNKVLEPTDYRYGLGDRYGRRICSECGKRRKINAYWADTHKVLCKQCALTGSNTLNYSMRGGKINIPL